MTWSSDCWEGLWGGVLPSYICGHRWLFFVVFCREEGGGFVCTVVTQDGVQSTDAVDRFLLPWYALDNSGPIVAVTSRRPRAVAVAAADWTPGAAASPSRPPRALQPPWPPHTLDTPSTIPIDWHCQVLAPLADALWPRCPPPSARIPAHILLPSAAASPAAAAHKRRHGPKHNVAYTADRAYPPVWHQASPPT